MEELRDIEDDFLFTLDSGEVVALSIVDCIDVFKMAYPGLRGVYFVWINGALIHRMVDNL